MATATPNSLTGNIHYHYNLANKKCALHLEGKYFFWTQSTQQCGLPQSTEESFAKIMSSLRSPSQSKCRCGGALSSTCSTVGEIFKIAAIMNGLPLVGVAIGFVLLRVEASVEEAAE